jgi:DNA-directed RNA polymerase specialized sigma24 family protein
VGRNQGESRARNRYGIGVAEALKAPPRPGRARSTGGAVERVTIAEAATLLGCHPNTVRNRVKAGMYRAEKSTQRTGQRG